MRKAFYVAAGAVLTLGLVSGLCLSLIRPVKGTIRKYYSKEAVKAAEDAIRDGKGEVTFDVPMSDALSIDGENGETDADLDKLLKDMSDLSSEYETLTLLGILEIPGINVKEPVFDSCSANALR